MKVSDYVAHFLANLGIKHVFVLTGGAAAHLIDSVAKHPDLDYICTQHEQAAAMAVDGYARVNGSMGAAIVTTGPGLTNIITGVASLYFDSIPSIFISGQVATSRLSEISPGVRQLGFQEAPHVQLMKPITKYSATVDDPSRIRYELEKAVNLANSGRPGPVFIDICDDVQRMEVEPEQLEPYVALETKQDLEAMKISIDQALELVAQAKRPVLVLGAAVKIAKVERQAKQLAEHLGFPVGLTWATMDMFPGDHPLNIGGFGITGPRRGNFAVQNSDLIFSIGSRLDTHATGTPTNTFARGAKKIIVDVEPSELSKFERQGMAVDVPIEADLRDFFSLLAKRIESIKTQDISQWLAQIQDWRTKYPSCLPEFDQQKGSVNPYVFLRDLSKETAEGEIIIADTGANLIQTFNGYCAGENQMMFSAFNNSPMGYSLAASIGACFANGRKPVICIIGDGGLQLNIQELGTIVKHKLPIKIFLFNNHGYGIIQQSQDQWLDSRYWASSPQTGLADPDYVKIAEAYGVQAVTVREHDGLRSAIRKVLDSDEPVLCNLEMSPDQRIIPMLQSDRPLEDAHPLLNREEFLSNMTVDPLEVSLSA